MKVTRESGPASDVGSVLTFDDVTELVVAQRTSAWADVARRIAHEIKNPLTPIQLSAERLRRKYGKIITEDRETFDRLTTTIERQVGDVKTHGRRVRRVRAHAQAGDGARTTCATPCTSRCSLFREGHPEIKFELAMPEQPMHRHRSIAVCITQAVTNLVKNAHRSGRDRCRERRRKPTPAGSGRVETRLAATATGSTSR